MIRKHRYIFLTALFCLIYISAYVIRCKTTEPLQINYYNMDETIDNGGIRYKIEDIDLCDKETFLNKYNLEESNLDFPYSEDEFKFFIVTKTVTKLQEDYNETINNDFIYTRLYSKYLLIGADDTSTRTLNERYEKKSLKELEVGESETLYQIFSIASCNHEKKLWDNYDKETYYFEITDNEYHKYLDRIRVYN